MKLLCNLLFFSFGWSAPLVSAGFPDPKAISEAWQSDVSEFSFVSYSVSGTLNNAKHPRLRLDWQEEDEKCLYSFEARNDDGGLNLSSTYSFDGERSLRMTDNDGLLIAQKAPWPIPPWVKNVEFITAPYDFLFRREAKPLLNKMPSTLLKDPHVFKAFAENSACVGFETRNGSECLVVRVNNTRDRFDDQIETYYLIFLDVSKKFRPVGWQQFTIDGRLMAEFEQLTTEEVVAQNTKRLLTVPKSLKISYYNYKDKNSQKHLSNSWQFDFSNLVFDSSKAKEFSLDLTSANPLYDQDENTWITIPK